MQITGLCKQAGTVAFTCHFKIKLNLLLYSLYYVEACNELENIKIKYANEKLSSLCSMLILLGSVHKRSPQSWGGGGGFVQCGQGGSSDADVHIFWCKNCRFFEIYGVSTQTRRG